MITSPTVPVRMAMGPWSAGTMSRKPETHYLLKRVTLFNGMYDRFVKKIYALIKPVVKGRLHTHLKNTIHPFYI